jgi:maltokinase
VSDRTESKGDGHTAGLTDLLGSWLPRQRWFPGRGSGVSEVSVISDVTLKSGDPGLRHLIVETPLHGATARFQVLVGGRAELPSSLDAALIGRADGIAFYDALHDPQLAAVLLRAIGEQRQAGQLRFVRDPTAPEIVSGSAAAAGDGRAAGPDSRVLTAEQSNTSLVFAERAILKVLRRLFPGANPDLEIADALARLGSARIAAPYGWIETVLDGEPVLLGVLSQFLADASDGWTQALANVQKLYARQAGFGHEYLTERLPAGARAGSGAATEPELAAMPFSDEARLLGAATAELHADLARAFGTRELTTAELAALAADMSAKLADAVAVVPQLRDHAPRILAAFDAVRSLASPVTVQRIHGDYHLGQVLRGRQGWVALDFEGEPAAPLAQRRALAPALRDVAGMLRSFDYAARHQLIGHPDAGGVADVAAAWVRRCHAEFCTGYAAAGGTDPDGHGTLLRALMLEKAVYEVVYEHRHRPSWMSIPLDFVAAA